MLCYFWILLLLALPSNGLHCCTKEPCMLEVLGEVVECQSACFLRTSARGGVVQRGCYDSWLGSPVDYSYEGCRMQQYLGENVEWCFCRNLGKGGSPCNANTREELHRSVYEKPFSVDPDKSSNEVSWNTQIPAQNDVVLQKPQAREPRTPLTLTENKVENYISSSLYGQQPNVPADDSYTSASGPVIDVRGYARQRGGARGVNHSPGRQSSSWPPYGPSQHSATKTPDRVAEVKGYARHPGVNAKAKTSPRPTETAYGVSVSKPAPKYPSGQVIDARGTARHTENRQRRTNFQERSPPAEFGPSNVAPNLSTYPPWNVKAAVPSQPQPRVPDNSRTENLSWNVYNRRVDEPTDHSTEVIEIRGSARHVPQATQSKSPSSQQSLYNRRPDERKQSTRGVGVRGQAKQAPQSEPKAQPQQKSFGPPVYSQPPPFTKPPQTQPPMPSYIQPPQQQVHRPIPQPNPSYNQQQTYSSKPPTVLQPRSQPNQKSSPYNPAKAAFMAFKASSPAYPAPQPPKPYPRPPPRPYSYPNRVAYPQPEQVRLRTKNVGMADAKSGPGQSVKPGDAKTGGRSPQAKKQFHTQPKSTGPPAYHQPQNHHNAVGTPKQRSPYTVPSGRTINYRHPNSINPFPTLNHPAAHVRSSRVYKPPVSLLQTVPPPPKSLLPLARPPVAKAPLPPPLPFQHRHHVAKSLPPANPQHNQVVPFKAGSPKSGKYGGLECFVCHDSSEHCGHTVSNPKRVSSTQCKTKCFLKKDTNGKLYRGCFDGWVTSSFTSDYNGCRQQTVGQYKPTWCFCDGDLCNGASYEGLGGKSSPGPSPPQHNLSPIIPYMSPLTRQSSPAPQQNVYVPKNYHGLLHVPKSHQVQAKVTGRRQQQKQQGGKDVDKLLSMFTELCKKSGVIRRQGTSHWACDIPLPK